jgi:hypothetical protein
MKIFRCIFIGLMIYWLASLQGGFKKLIPSVHAASDFSTSFESVYTIQESGDTSVTHTISLKNNLAHIYATEYTIATSGEDLKNISSSDESGSIITKSLAQNGITTIHMMIDRPSIGLGQVKTITLSYSTSDVIEKIGDTITINIPRLEKANEALNYKRIVKIQGVEGMKEYIYPSANIKTVEDGYVVYMFDGHENDSLSLLFGDSVTYKLNLTYELKNSELQKAETELALPSDTPYQQIILDNIDPAPLSMRVDQSGNWMARYSLDANSKQIVKVVLYATVYPEPSQIDPSSTHFVDSSKSKYWQTSSSTVMDLATRLKSPANIYTYLVENFSYNYSGLNGKVERLGAISAITSPSNVLCTEFTDAFVALTRTLNIPAREINGYGYTKNATLQPQNSNTDILHAWPEYYSQENKTWIAVDPTWGNTTGGINYLDKLDYSHITFVRHGEEDSYPLPAGAYKSTFSDKFVEVEVAKDIPERVSKTEINGDKIKNIGNIAIRSDELGYLPPYGSTNRLDSKHLTLYDKIKQICAKLLSIF